MMKVFHFVAVVFVAGSACFAQTLPSGQAQQNNPGGQKVLYVVGYAHLDTQWRWSYPQVIAEFLRNTMEDNFKLFEKYPHYIFNFTGANRYLMMKQYYPEDFEKLKKYVAAGRWFRRVVHGRRGCEYAQRGRRSFARCFMAMNSFRGIWEAERGIHVAGLFRISGVAAEHLLAHCGIERVFDAEIDLGVGGGDSV